MRKQFKVERTHKRKCKNKKNGKLLSTKRQKKK